MCGVRPHSHDSRVVHAVWSMLLWPSRRASVASFCKRAAVGRARGFNGQAVQLPLQYGRGGSAVVKAVSQPQA